MHKTSELSKEFRQPRSFHFHVTDIVNISKPVPVMFSKPTALWVPKRLSLVIKELHQNIPTC